MSFFFPSKRINLRSLISHHIASYIDECLFGEFSCNTTHILICVDIGRLCDGVATCPDRTDEINCGIFYSNRYSVKYKQAKT